MADLPKELLIILWFRKKVISTLSLNGRKLKRNCRIEKFRNLIYLPAPAELGAGPRQARRYFLWHHQISSSWKERFGGLFLIEGNFVSREGINSTGTGIFPVLDNKMKGEREMELISTGFEALWKRSRKVSSDNRTWYCFWSIRENRHIMKIARR